MSDKPDDSNGPATTDELEAAGFKWDGDGESMYRAVGVLHSLSPQVVCGICTNSRSDEYLTARSLALYWEVQPKISGMFAIDDNPTIKQVIALVKSLEGDRP